jgi:hypothetical protein
LWCATSRHRVETRTGVVQVVTVPGTPATVTIRRADSRAPQQAAAGAMFMPREDAVRAVGSRYRLASCRACSA